MKEPIATLMAALSAFAFIAAGAWLTSEYSPTRHIAPRLEQIRTDSAKTYPQQTSTGRCNFVEMVPDSHAAQYAARR